MKKKKSDEIQGNPVTFGWKKRSTSYRVLAPAKHLTLKDQARLSMHGTDRVLIQEFQLHIGTHPFSFFKTKCRRKALLEPVCPGSTERLAMQESPKEAAQETAPGDVV